MYLPPLSKISCLQVWRFIFRLSIMFCWSVFLFLCQYHAVLMIIALYYSLKSGRLILPALFFFLKIALAIQGLLCFHTNCERIFSSSVRNIIDSFIGIALNLQIDLGKYGHFHNIDASNTVQFTSVAQSCLTLCNLMDCSTPGFPAHYEHLELAQTHVHQLGDAIKISDALSSCPPPAFNLSQHQGFFK